MSTVLDDFVRSRVAAADLLDQLAELAVQAGTDRQRPLELAATRAREGRFVVLLLGCFSSGKSTLLNAMLGRPVLPVKVNPCTAILTEVVYGDTPGVTVRQKNGSETSHTIEDFLDTYQLRTTEDSAGAEAADRFGAIDRAIVRWPLPLLKNGVVLLDTPGLDDDPTRTARTLASLPDADAVIFTLSANRFLTDLERTTLQRDLLPLGLTNLFFPTTMVDLLAAISDDPDAELASLRRRAAETLGELGAGRFFPLDARGALHARWSRANSQPELNEAALAHSGLPAFESELESFLVHERGTAQLAQLYHTANRVRDELQRQAALDEATAQTDLHELIARQAALEPRFAELDRIRRRVGRTIDGFIHRTSVVVWQDLRGHLAKAERDLPEAVIHFDLGGLASLDLLTQAGRDRVEARLHTELDTWLQARMETWRQALEPKLEAALLQLRDELAAEAQDFDDLTEEILAQFAGKTFGVPPPKATEQTPIDPVERWFSVVVGAALLSPGAVAAGWSEGYEGALKGAAGRLGVRLAILGIGALLGPVGWVGLVLYAVSDAVLLWATGGTQLKRLRSNLADKLQGTLVGQADSARDELQTQVAAALAPIRVALLATTEREASEVRSLLDQSIAARTAAVRGAEARHAHWDDLLQRYDAQLTALRAVCER